MNKQNCVSSDFSDSWYSGGIVYQVVSPSVSKISLDIAYQLVRDRTEAMGDQQNVLVLVNVNNAKSVSKEANQYYRTGNPYENIKAIAMVMDNYIARMVASIVFMFEKIPCKIEFFNSEEKAKNWLSNLN